MASSPDTYFNEVVSNYAGTVGKMISAILQTAGLFAQSTVIEGVRTNLASVATLIYAVAVVTAIVSVALYGNYRKGAYLLIGPALFHWMLNDVTPAGPTMVRYGNRTFSESGNEQLSLLRVISSPDNYKTQPQISTFYAVFDTLVSDLVQQLVAFLINTENKQDIINAGKERVYSKVLSMQSSNAGYTALVSLGIAGHCAEVMGINQRRSAIMKQQDTGPQNNPARQAELERLTSQYEEMRRLRVISLNNELRDYLGTIGFKDIPEPVSCEDIWDYTKTASLKEADLQLANATSDEGNDSQVPWDKVKKEIQDTFNKDNPESATEVVAAHIFKNTLSKAPPAQALSNRLAGRGNFDPLLYNAIFRDNANAQSRGGMMLVQYFAASIPYIQGLLLFLLSAAFPFFTMFLLMPSRASSFFVWMSLWVWVKSWDVGFAFIDVLKDFLFPFFTKGAKESAEAINWDDPSSVFSVVTQHDPLATYNTYITIIGMLTVGVPAITAHFCMGATNLYDAFKNSIDKNANRFAALRTSAARRVNADKVEIDMFRAAVREQERRVAEAGEEKGKTSGGVDRHQEGRGALSRHMQGAGDRGSFDYHYSSGQMRKSSVRGAHTGRRATLGGGLPENVVAANVNTMNEKDNARPLGFAGSEMPGLADDRHAENNHKYDSKSTSDPKVTDSGGGD